MILIYFIKYAINNLTTLYIQTVEQLVHFLTLRALLQFPPYSILTDNADGSVTVSGINGDVMLYLQQALNFT